MREIKFRAWDTETNNWVESLTLTLHTSGRLVNMPDGVILMQYTGLKDNIGVDIYEGDIINIEESVMASVEYSEIEACFVFSIPRGRCQFMHDTASCYLRVIGNIYEHPDDLK